MAEDMKPNEARRKKLVPVLARVLAELCKRNDHIPVDPSHVTKFHALRAPAISIEDYLQRYHISYKHIILYDIQRI